MSATYSPRSAQASPQVRGDVQNQGSGRGGEPPQASALSSTGGEEDHAEYGSRRFRDRCGSAAAADPTGRSCARCGGSMEGRAAQARYCSHTCKQYAYYERNPEAHQAIRATARDRQKANAIKANLEPRRCERCGEDYQPRSRRSRFCSSRCARRSSSA